jgi:hypothetical protein
MAPSPLASGSMPSGGSSQVSGRMRRRYWWLPRGGWVNADVVVKVYQRPTVEQVRARFAQVRHARELL